MTEQEIRHIVVEGPIGVGKRRLAEKLAHHYNAQLVLDKHEENSLLDKFYQEPKSHALATQLQFLFNRHQAMETLRRDKGHQSTQVSDFLIEKDRVFAFLNLSDEELQIYEKVYSLLVKQETKADFVIYLQADADTLMKRIRKNQERSEPFITKDYLKRVVDAYTSYFFNFEHCPLLIINTKTLNFLDKQADFLRLVSQIDTIHSGTHYFNPSK